jgi:hypothetical protein
LLLGLRLGLLGLLGLRLGARSSRSWALAALRLVDMHNQDVSVCLSFLQPSSIFFLVKPYSQPIRRQCKLRIHNLHIPKKYP